MDFALELLPSCRRSRSFLAGTPSFFQGLGRLPLSLGEVESLLDFLGGKDLQERLVRHVPLVRQEFNTFEQGKCNQLNRVWPRTRAPPAQT